MLKFTNKFLTEFFNQITQETSAAYTNEFLPVIERRTKTTKIVEHKQDFAGLDIYAPNTKISGCCDDNFDVKTYEMLRFARACVLEKDVLCELSEYQEIAQGQTAGTFASDYLRQKSQEMLSSVWRTMNYVSWQAMSGQFTADVYGGTTITVDYEFPAAFTPTVANPWNAGGAVPFEDIADWIQVFQDEQSPFVPATMVMNSITAQQMIENSNVITTVTNTAVSQVEAIRLLLPLSARNITVVIEDGYTIAGGATAKFVADGKVLLIGEGIEGRQVGNFVTGIHPYAGVEDLETFATGPFLVKGNVDMNPISQELLGGFVGIPVLTSNKAILAATVF